MRREERPGVLTYFDHRALDRAEKISSDISALNSILESSTSDTTHSSVMEYLNSLPQSISDTRLLAHHYIRYLGDLSGGQAISKLVSRHYQVPDSALNFYDFNSIGDIVFYKNRYRNLLNLIDLSPEEKSEFLQEVVKLYSLNREIFLDLGKNDDLLDGLE